MKKKFITYSQDGRIKKAVLDENLLSQYRNNPMITEIVEYSDEMLMERRFAEAVGKNVGNKKQLLD